MRTGRSVVSTLWGRAETQIYGTRRGPSDSGARRLVRQDPSYVCIGPNKAWEGGIESHDVRVM